MGIFENIFHRFTYNKNHIFDQIKYDFSVSKQYIYIFKVPI